MRHMLLDAGICSSIAEASLSAEQERNSFHIALARLCTPWCMCFRSFIQIAIKLSQVSDV